VSGVKGHGGSFRFHRGYRITRKSFEDIQFHCVYIRKINFFLPRSFDFTGPFQVLEQYINYICIRDKFNAQGLEKYVCNKVIEPAPQPEDQLVFIDARTLIAILRGEDTAQVPAHGLIRFITNSRFFVPSSFVASLASEGILTEEEAAGKWEKTHLITDKMHKTGWRDEDWHTGMSLKAKRLSDTMPPGKERLQQLLKEHRADVADFEAKQRAKSPTAPGEIPSPEAPAAAADVPAAPASNIPSTVVVFESDEERMWRVEQLNQPTYYARELLVNGVAVWKGTSFSQDGPWTCYQVDHKAMLAAGIQP
jgi:hypothetical protein